MKYTILGKTGLEVSRICLGMMSYGNSQEWYLDLDKARPIIKKALDLGINFFDTANVYSGGRSEEITGEVLKEYRDDIVVATKAFFPIEGFNTGGKPNKHGLSRYHIKKAIDDSLKRLQMDHVDLYQIHRLDKRLPVEEILRSLNHLIDDGKTLHIGASSMFAWQFTKSLWMAEKYGLEPFRTMQNHYNLAYREEEREMIPLCIDQGIGVIPWSPLGRGFLTGKYKRNEEPTSVRVKSDRLLKERYFSNQDFDIVDRIVETASNKGVKPAQVSLAWLFSKNYISAPIVGATKIEHLEEAVQALEINLNQEEIKYLEEPYTPHAILGHN
ncbi:MAG: aldo/keto reductase [Candidatus Thorarchaeota archaeon]